MDDIDDESLADRVKKAFLAEQERRERVATLREDFQPARGEKVPSLALFAPSDLDTPAGRTASKLVPRRRG